MQISPVGLAVTDEVVRAASGFGQSRGARSDNQSRNEHCSPAHCLPQNGELTHHGWRTRGMNLAKIVWSAQDEGA